MTLSEDIYTWNMTLFKDIHFMTNYTAQRPMDGTPL